MNVTRPAGPVWLGFFSGVATAGSFALEVWSGALAGLGGLAMALWWSLTDG